MQLLSYPELKTLGIKYSKSHIYYLMQRNQFPRPVRLSANTVAFLRQDIDDWIDQKIQAHRSERAKFEVNHE